MFGYEPQVTSRIAPSNFGALWANEVFWDGRAASRFVDPLTGEVAIEAGGALENQTLAPLENPVFRIARHALAAEIEVHETQPDIEEVVVCKKRRLVTVHAA